MPRKGLFEQLESRQMLAANVVSYVAFRDLYIQTSDADARFRVTSLDNGDIAIESLDGNTKINGQNDPTTIKGLIDDVLIDLGSVRNVVELTDLNLVDQLAMTVRWGGNKIHLDNVVARGDTFINHLKGHADLNIVDSVFNSSLTVTSNEGNDLVQLIDTDVRKNLSIVTGRGNDDVAIVSSSVSQLATLNTSSVGRELFPSQDVDHVCLVDDVFTALSVTLGNDADRLDLAATTVFSKASFDGGTGFDTLGQASSNAIAPGPSVNFEVHTHEIECDLLPYSTLFTNPSDSLLLQVAADDGTIVEYFGQKNSAGLARSLDVMTVQSAFGTTIIEVDQRGRPTKLVAPAGETFTLVWLTDLRVLATAISADGSLQSSAIVDWVDPAYGSIPSPWFPPSSNPRGFARGSTSPLTKVTPNVSGPPNELPVAAHLTSFIDVSVCGLPAVDAIVMMSVKPSSGVSFNVPARHLGDGRYAAAIPNSQGSASATPDAICDSVINVLSARFLVGAVPHGFGSQICAALAAAVDFGLGGPTDQGATIIAACEAAFGAYDTAGKLNTEPGIPATPGIFQAVCDSLSAIANRATGSRFSLTPTAFVPGQGAVTGTTRFTSTSGPFPYFSLLHGTITEVVSFRTTPVNPAPFQGYVATVSVACPIAGTSVTLSIVGSDGYTDSVTFTVQGNSDLHFFIPGAAEGVIDTITVTISGELARTISLELF